MKPVSKKAEAVRASTTLAVDSMAKQMKADGYDVDGFGTGEPDFETPENIRFAAIDAIKSGKTKYTPAAGIVPLRKAIAEQLKREGYDYDYTQIVVASGAKHSLFIALSAITNPGDEIILPATTSEVSLTLPTAPNGKNITIKYPDGASVVPAALNITAVNAASLTIVAPQTHVEVNGITVTNLTASTSNTTLVIGDDVTVTNLTIEAGAVEIYGNVGTLTKGANAGDVKVWAVGDIETWKKAYTAGAQKIELTANISSAEETNLYVPVQGTVEGNGNQISGSISLNVNALGGTIQNLNFKDIHKSDNKLSAI